jgi:membrane protein YdbS with pleckstrin-like domain
MSDSVPAPEEPAARTRESGAPGARHESIADGVDRSLDPRAIAVHRASGWIATASISLMLLVGIGVLLLLWPPSRGAAPVLVGFWVLTTTAFAWFSHRWPPIAHRHAAYRVDPDGLEIRRGVYWRHVIYVPRSRVQHTDVSEGPLERSYGLGTLVIYTAGTEHAQVELHGLDRGTALRIRDHLLPREGPDAV